MDRQPCPHRIYDDLGIGFTMGGVVGGIWNFGKGYYNAPKGEKLSGCITTMKTRGPVLGGNFAVWGGLFSTIECGLMYYRGKEDFMNSIISGFLTGGILAIRGGWKATLRSAAFGGIFLGMIEGVGVLLNMFVSMQQQQMVQQQQQQQEGEGTGGWIPEPPSDTFPILNSKSLDGEFDFVPGGVERI
ncbi:hypothetical protein ABK040_001613 [Willaertia magna]